MADLDWSTDTDWSNAQSSSNVAIDGGSFELADAIPDSEVSRYDFENSNNDTSVLEDIWADNDGEVSGATYQPTGGDDGNGAFDFDGVDDEITLVDFKPGGDYAVSGWINTDTAGGTVIGDSNTGSGWFVSISDGSEFSAGRLKFGFNDGAGNTASDTDVIGSWYHFVCQINSNTAEIYINGSQEGSNSGKSWVDAGVAAIGSDNGNKYYDGQVSEISLYNKALTSTEVSNLYNTGSISG